MVERTRKKEKKTVANSKKNTGKEKHFIRPMLAQETENAFDDPDWLFEIKWDGYRAISEINRGKVSLYSRNGISFARRYTPVYEALRKIQHNAVLDGEIVVLDENGRSNFQKLQHYEENQNAPICFYVFDLLSLHTKDTTGLPLTYRKELLRSLLEENPVIRYADHIREKGIAFFRTAADRGLEGIMAKKADSIYLKGKRSSDWLKIKHHKTEEAIIAGFTRPRGGRKKFGALVLALRGNSGLVYAGHTGSGFSDADLKDIYQQLKPLKTKISPFSGPVKTNMPVTWVKPKYVCEVKFTEWTNDGKMRHPIFLRMRTDKKPKDVIMKKTKTKASKMTSTKKTKRTSKEADILTFGNIKVPVTHPDKIFWPEEKISKKMVIDYYQDMAEYILPYLKNRPESLKRNPNGIQDKGFFQKDAGEEAPDFVHSISIYSESSEKDIDYILCNNKATLAYLNNLGCIELNPWNARVASLDKPDYMIIDIDPSEGNTFEEVIEAAQIFKELLGKAGADAYCKTSGATGLHIFVPVHAKYTYDQVRNFAEILCRMAHEQIPRFTSVERNLKKRGKKIYLDYLQNSRGQTLASAYSLRPVPNATVSAPLEWKEIKSGLHPSMFTMQNILKRVQKKGDIFRPVLGKGIDLKKCLSRLSE